MNDEQKNVRFNKNIQMTRPLRIILLRWGLFCFNRAYSIKSKVGIINITVK